ncbi:uncharacterized iron-regulated membrane protein [Corynebacterium suranareeae]|uniref:Uncharacterized iron-regulated membrane protein n=1 Tax=Corynebacterium suranareeae TaxID=2506452 RepID=A0A160PSF1_9CORY|nr:PepSY domain-containing protein [Corynebacterium suranareeae]BAU96654.1 uncharacterized iron-regulated membrane protein [Corynebacterium suranareeae]
MTFTRTSVAPSQALRLLHRLHFFAGVICAPLILIAALTGLVYSFAPTIENLSNQKLLTVEVEDTRLPVSELVDIAQQHHPDLPVTGVRIGDETSTTRVLFADDQLPESTVHAVFINPYSGEITGDTTQYGSSAALPFRHWISQGHRMLWLGEPGRIYSELAASWLGVLAMGGFALLWLRQRKPRRVQAMLRTGGSGRVKTYRRHAALGTIAGLGFIFLTFTGLTWSSYAGANISTLRAELNWTQPALDTSLTSNSASIAHDEHAGHHMPMAASISESESIDLVASTALENLRTPLTITPPSESGQAWTAAENRQSFRFTTDAIAINGETGALTNRLNSADWPLAAQASAWLIQLHMGTLLGFGNQVVLAALAISITIMICLGYSLLWQRRPRSGWPAAPRRVVLQHPTKGTLILGAALLAYCVLAPLFAVSLIAFIVISLCIHFVRTARKPQDSAL